ncbi:MAG TPA: hypothetical protein VF062_22245 [Candidatus Limnocylindrales bacterium]
MTEMQRTARGFQYGEPVHGSHADHVNGGELPDGSFVRVYESSAAFGPHIWMQVSDSQETARTHLSLESARRVRDQLTYLLDHHYQLAGDL